MSESITYTVEDLLQLARRVNNPKRSYLLVNPLQGKHIPVNPSDALTMMQTLGKAVKEKHIGCPLVIGFSETATAIGAAVAVEIGNHCTYLQTTREQDDSVGKWVYFSEDHSHAAEQKLCGDDLERRISCCDYILLVDDEISTGNTILNIVSAIRTACPVAEKKDFVVASLINRVDKHQLPKFTDQRISFIYLLHLDEEDYEEKAKAISVQEASSPSLEVQAQSKAIITRLSHTLPAARLGVMSENYHKACQEIIEEVLQKTDISNDWRILVLGTEEFMYPALLLALQIQNMNTTKTVKFHATTRSPIGISTATGYPITNGIRLHSMYSMERVSYLYDIDVYDAAIVFSDSPEVIPEAVTDLQRGLEEKHCSNVQFFYGGQYV